MSITWGRLKKEVLALGFESDAVYDSYRDNFITAANSALDILSETVRPLDGVVSMYRHPAKNLLGNSGVAIHDDSGSPTYGAQGVRAFYFECDANGTAVITDDEKETRIALVSNGEFVAYKGFATGNVELRFEGEFEFAVKNVAMYGSLKGDTESDIPSFGDKVPYDMSSLVGECFLGFVSSPIRCLKDGVLMPLDGGEVADGTAYLPYDFEGEFKIFYRRRHRLITEATQDDEIIEIASGLETLLPLLMANRIWLDDDERKATFYWNKYEILRSRLRLDSTSSYDTEFVNERGW